DVGGLRSVLMRLRDPAEGAVAVPVFDRDLEIQVHSAVRLCRAVLPAMAKARFGRVLFIQTSYTIGCPPKNTAA
ncbi:MAG TPA: hypothetical protein PKX81_01940, partial [Gemmiger formicilis]|nr:hypothetical protein [Gemmiger formicilis]